MRKPISTRKNNPDFRGELQTEIMAAAWGLEGGTVEQIRSALPSEVRPAYNTVQTVLNRLEARGLLERKKDGRAHLYIPAVTEADFVSRSLGEKLAEASPGARRLALLNLVDALKPDEVDEIARRAQQIQARREKD